MPHTLPFGLSGVDPDLVSWIGDALDRAEAALHEAVGAQQPLLRESAGHLAAAGGKRFRPLLALLAAQYGERDREANVDGAVVAELTHLATLYHDDVMDEATVRRGADSANSRWGNTVAILTGDYLFARAADIAAGLGPRVVTLQARTFQRLVEGQIRETMGPEPSVAAVDHHLEVLADKTGSLISASARMGALTSDADDRIGAVLAQYGEAIGVAFQLSDDLLDIVSSDSGKAQGTDLREGILTLPALYALRDPQASRLAELLRQPLFDDAEHAEALELLQEHPAIEEARSTLQNWAQRARRALNPLAEIPTAQTIIARSATEALDQLCDAVVTRTV